MESASFQAVNLRLDLLRDVVLELISAQEPGSAERALASIGGRWTQRASELALNPQTDELMAADLALVLAALGQAKGRAARAAVAVYASA